VQRSFITVAAFAVLVGSMASPVAAEPRPDAKPSPRPSSPAPSSADAPFCPVATSVVDADGTKTRYAVVFRAIETGRASGVVSLYAGNRRYDVPFHDVVALDTRDLTTPATPVVVRFATPTVIDGAAVTSIDDNGLKPCAPLFSPWSSAIPMNAQSAADRRRYELLRARARTDTGLEVPSPADDPVSCAVPYRRPRTTYAFEPTSPFRDAHGTSTILVMVGTDDRVLGGRVERSSGNTALDRVALDAAGRSRFVGSIFRCKPVIGIYLFTVDFNG
jgi:hypothetical protein